MRIGIIGYGGMGRHHAAQTALNPALELAAVADPSLEARARATADHQVRTFDIPATMLQHCKLDGVIVAAPTVHHAAAVEAAARAGKHVFCEKPLCLRLQDATALAKVVEESGITFGFGLVLRYMAPYEAARQLIRGGELGQVLLAHARYGGMLGGYAYVYDPNVGGGLLNEHTIHMIDALDYLLGPAQAVTAVLSRVEGRRTEDNAAILLHLPNGVGATLAGSGTTRFTSMAEITGAHGEIAITGNSKLFRVEQGGRVEVELPAGPDPYYLEVEEWRQAIAEKRQPRTGMPEALRIFQVLDAIHRSSETGQTVRLTP